MVGERQLYSTVTRRADGTIDVHLGDNHPGLTDPAYRARRGQIAAAALAAQPGGPAPTIDYTPAEHEVWAIVCAELAPKHIHAAHPEFLAAKRALALPSDAVPQLTDVSAALLPRTGWTYAAAPGLVPLREFYAGLARRVFHSTQYLRHPSQPLYTPEPDIIHEVVGHANQLASPRFARLTEAAGLASLRVESDAAMKAIADVFWFTIEFGVIWERGALTAYGAGILSSYGEMDAFAQMEIRPLDVAAMTTIDYDITTYQPVLFAANSLDQLEDVVGGFFDTVDDDGVARRTAARELADA